MSLSLGFSHIPTCCADTSAALTHKLINGDFMISVCAKINAARITSWVNMGLKFNARDSFCFFIFFWRTLSSVCLAGLVSLSSKLNSNQFCFAYFRSFMVCWTAPCSFLKYRTQKIRRLYTDITWRPTKVSQYFSFENMIHLSQSIWLTILPRNALSRNAVFSATIHRWNNFINHKNYNFLDCDWFKKNSYFQIIHLSSCYRTVQ